MSTRSVRYTAAFLGAAAFVPAPARKFLGELREKTAQGGLVAQ